MNKKWIPLFILLLVATLAIISIFYHAPTSKFLQTNKRSEVMETGTITTTSYTNSFGFVVVAADKGYASIRTIKDEEGHTILEEYLDERGKLITLSAGYAAVSYTLSDGLTTEIHYLDEEMQPVVISSGYDTIHRTYNDRRLADTDTYWISNQPIMTTQGFAEYRRIYNDKKQTIMLEYRGFDGELINTNSGYARRIRSFNDQNKVIEERYYGPEGQPSILSLGQSGYKRLYDSEGRTIETTYIGKQGDVINTNRGYATVRISYGDDGSTVTQYYDKDGKPVTGGNSNYGILNTGEQKIYLNEDGEIIQRLDNVLMTHPLLVLAIGMILTVLSLFLRGKIRWVFLIIYFLFVLYMTMYYREPGGSRNRLELFYSYRRILTNDSLRQQVVNNFLLFIPLGTILSNLFMYKISVGKTMAITVLICMAMSIGIEVIQWKFGIGLADVDDVISNVLGGVIGTTIAAFARPTKYRSQETITKMIK